MLSFVMMFCVLYYDVICCFLEYKLVKKEKSFYLNLLNKMMLLNVMGKGEIIIIWILFGK